MKTEEFRWNKSRTRTLVKLLKMGMNDTECSSSLSCNSTTIGRERRLLLVQGVIRYRKVEKSTNYIGSSVTLKEFYERRAEAPKLTPTQIKERMIEYLVSQSTTTAPSQEIFDYLFKWFVHEPTADVLLKELLTEGRVEKVSRGVYRLSENFYTKPVVLKQRTPKPKGAYVNVRVNSKPASSVLVRTLDRDIDINITH